MRNYANNKNKNMLDGDKERKKKILKIIITKEKK